MCIRDRRRRRNDDTSAHHPPPVQQRRCCCSSVDEVPSQLVAHRRRCFQLGRGSSDAVDRHGASLRTTGTISDCRVMVEHVCSECPRLAETFLTDTALKRFLRVVNISATIRRHLNQWRSDGGAGGAGRTGRHLLGAAEDRKTPKIKKNSRENSDCKFHVCLRARKAKRYGHRVPVVSYNVGSLAASGSNLRTYVRLML